MEITKLTKNALRLKGKKSTLVFDVLDTKKIEANAFLYLTENALEASFGNESLLINGSGEYEVSGVKISATQSGEEIAYEMLFDGMKILLVSSTALLRMKDKIDEQNVVVLFANEALDQSALTNVAPTVVVCYGDKAGEVSQNLGKGLNKKEGEAETVPDADIKPTDKVVLTAEKLPAELQVVLLA